MRPPRITDSELMTAQDAARVSAAIAAASRNRGDVVPPDFLTAQDWGRLWGTVELNAMRRLEAGVALGIIECAKYRIFRGGLRAVKHYRAKK